MTNEEIKKLITASLDKLDTGVLKLIYEIIEAFRAED